MVLFFFCEFFESPVTLIQASPVINTVFFLTAIWFLEIGIIFIVYVFNREIKRHENAQNELIAQLKEASKEIRELYPDLDESKKE